MAILKSGQTIGVCIHHSVYKPANNLTELKAQAKLFDGWHKAKSWAETTKTPSAYPYISYHYLMATDGSMLKVTDEKYVKYHAGDNFRGIDSYNLHGIAVCLTGNYETDKPTEAQMKALVLFIRDVERRYKINANVRGHKQTSESATACPGKNIGISTSGWLKTVIANVNNSKYPPVVVPPVEPPEDPQIADLKKQITTLNAKIKSLETHQGSLEDTIGVLEGEKSLLEGDVIELEAEVEKYKKYESMYKEAVKQISELKAEAEKSWLQKLLEILFPEKS